MVERALEKGVPEKRIYLFPNWVDTNSIYPLDEGVKKSITS